MRSSSSLLLLPLAASAILYYFYLPYFHTFVGTDLGVYWEVSRRLYTDHHLALFQNYYDNKPILIYLWFLPFQLISIGGHEMMGLKLAVYFFYMLNGLVVFTALGLHYAGRGLRRLLLNCVGCSAFFATALSWRDYAQNGVVSVGAISFAAAGLLILSHSILRRPRRAYALYSGFLLGTAPFFRPQGGTGILLLSVMLVVVRCGWFYLPRGATGDRGVQPSGEWAAVLSTLKQVAGAATLTMATWLSLTLVLGSSLADLRDVLSTDLRRAALRRATTGVVEFLTQDRFFFVMGVAFLFAGCLTVFLALLKRGCSRRVLYVAAVWGGYLAVEVGLAIYLRKIQSHYVFHFFLPILFGSLWLTASLDRRASGLGSLIMAVLCLLLPARVVYDRYRSIPAEVYGKSWASEMNVSTGMVITAISGLGVKRPRILVLGDRANLYSLAALKQVPPYDWNTDASLFLAEFKSDDFFDAWFGKFLGDPAEFVVRVRPSGDTSVPRLRGARDERVRAVLAERYSRVAVIEATNVEWPYAHYHTYEVYCLNSSLSR